MRKLLSFIAILITAIVITGCNSHEDKSIACVEKNLAPYEKKTDEYVNSDHSYTIDSSMDVVVDRKDSNILKVNYDARIRTESGKHRKIIDLPTYDLQCSI
jgi:hypothetical protein